MGQFQLLQVIECAAEDGRHLVGLLLSFLACLGVDDDVVSIGNGFFLYACCRIEDGEAFYRWQDREQLLRFTAVECFSVLRGVAVGVVGRQGDLLQLITAVESHRANGTLVL